MDLMSLCPVDCLRDLIWFYYTNMIDSDVSKRILKINKSINKIKRDKYHGLDFITIELHICILLVNITHLERKLYFKRQILINRLWFSEDHHINLFM